MQKNEMDLMAQSNVKKLVATQQSDAIGKGHRLGLGLKSYLLNRNLGVSSHGVSEPSNTQSSYPCDRMSIQPNRDTIASAVKNVPVPLTENALVPVDYAPASPAKGAITQHKDCIPSEAVLSNHAIDKTPAGFIMDVETQSSDESRRLDVQASMDGSSSQQPPQQERKRNGPYRGPSRAKKYKIMRLNQPQKLKIDIPPHLGAVVGDRAKQFVAECSDWVKRFCRIDVVSWKHMPQDVLNQLYAVIKDKYELPVGTHTDKALSVQCRNLFRHWRERLKKKYFNGVSFETALSTVPPDVKSEQWRWLCCHWNSAEQKERSEKNRANALSVKMYSAHGAKSTARVLYEMEVAAKDGSQDETEVDTQPGTEIESNTEVRTTPTTDEPVYITAWITLKRHKNGKLDDEAEQKLQKFKELHEKQIRENGVDHLTIEEAFLEVLGYRTGYTRGLGKGAPVVSKVRGLGKGASEMGKGRENEAVNRYEACQLRDDEARLLNMIQKLQTEANEAREREIQREQEMKEREEKFREEINVAMQAKMDAFLNNLQGMLVRNHGILLEDMILNLQTKANEAQEREVQREQEIKERDEKFCEEIGSSLQAKMDAFMKDLQAMLVKNHGTLRQDMIERLEKEANKAREREVQREQEIKGREGKFREEINATLRAKMDAFMSNLQAMLFNPGGQLPD